MRSGIGLERLVAKGAVVFSSERSKGSDSPPTLAPISEWEVGFPLLACWSYTQIPGSEEFFTLRLAACHSRQDKDQNGSPKLPALTFSARLSLVSVAEGEEVSGFPSFYVDSAERIGAFQPLRRWFLDASSFSGGCALARENIKRENATYIPNNRRGTELNFYFYSSLKKRTYSGNPYGTLNLCPKLLSTSIIPFGAVYYEVWKTFSFRAIYRVKALSFWSLLRVEIPPFYEYRIVGNLQHSKNGFAARNFGLSEPFMSAPVMEDGSLLRAFA
ncbi:hypothetical protein COLO4_04441 [Corchorus olitorius]|uniref:Uncharacterized protein n=1 Tax=Corchorus olitorius TaxID=93759 RepID=A0A1R3KTX6_9ROSI|nr:hypothetical protein COLO4_04441 [Corchorus olitorius]